MCSRPTPGLLVGSGNLCILKALDGEMILLDLITQVRNLAWTLERKGQEELAAKPRAVADQEEATKEPAPRNYEGPCRRSDAADRPPA
jgi:hypothetical protein